MESNKNSVEFIDQNKERNENKKGAIKEFLDGSLLTKKIVLEQFPYLIFLTFLALIYIANRYHAEKVVRRTNTIQNELKELRSEAITMSSKLMEISRQSSVIKLIKKRKLDLTEPIKPAKRIVIDKEF